VFRSRWLRLRRRRCGLRFRIRVVVVVMPDRGVAQVSKSARRTTSCGQGFGNRRLAHSLPLDWPDGPCFRFAQVIPFAVSQTAQVSRFGNLRYADAAMRHPRNGIWGGMENAKQPVKQGKERPQIGIMLCMTAQLAAEVLGALPGVVAPPESRSTLANVLCPFRALRQRLPPSPRSPATQKPILWSWLFHPSRA
jgi:hypothetical protein